MKADEAYTYLQCAFDPIRVREQMRSLKERFGSEILFHMEFWKSGDGRMIPGAIPLVYYKTEERLNEMIDRNNIRGRDIWACVVHAIHEQQGAGVWTRDTEKTQDLASGFAAEP